MAVKSSRPGYGHILKYTGVFGSVQGMNILVGILRNKLVALLLGPQGMGLAALFNSTIKLVSDATSLGIGMSAVREVSDAYGNGDEERLRGMVALIRRWSLVAALAGMLLCAVLSPLLNRWTFEWGDHTLHFVLLSPIVALLAITGGEMAILKGTRRLRSLATITVFHAVAALVTSVPIYYFWGYAGIIPSLFVIALVQMLLTIGFSYHHYPLSTRRPHPLGATPFRTEGLRMLRLGVAFVLAGIMGSGADFLIRSFLNTHGSLNAVGLYNAGYTITMTYAGMVFTAMETDYFPRLSAVQGLGAELSRVVNQQIEVSLLLVSPALVAFQVFLPILLPALYSGKFLPVMGMVHVMVLAMYVRAITLPIAYLPLAKGHSYVYLLMEAIYDVAIVGLVMLFYHLYGLTGTGWAIALTTLIDLVVLAVAMRIKYGYRLSAGVIRYAIAQVGIGLAAFALTFCANGWAYYAAGILLTLGSLAFSLAILKRKTRLWEALVRKLRKP